MNIINDNLVFHDLFINSRLMKFLKPTLFHHIFNKDNHLFIAGGTLTSVFSGSRVNDIDVFSSSKEYIDKFKDWIIEKFTPPDFEEKPNKLILSQLTTNNAYSFTLLDDKQKIKIQLIRKVHDIPSELIKKFDFTISMAAITSSFEIITDNRFLIDLAAKNLVYNPNADYPIASLYRLQKFIKRGYTIKAASLVMLALKANSIPITSNRQLKEQLEGIDTMIFGDFLTQLNDTEPFDFKAFIPSMFSQLEEHLNNIIGEDDGSDISDFSSEI